MIENEPTLNKPEALAKLGFWITVVLWCICLMLFGALRDSVYFLAAVMLMVVSFVLRVLSYYFRTTHTKDDDIV